MTALARHKTKTGEMRKAVFDAVMQGIVGVRNGADPGKTFMAVIAEAKAAGVTDADVDHYERRLRHRQQQREGQ